MWLNKRLPRVDPRGRLNSPLQIQLDGTFLPKEYLVYKTYSGENGYGYLLRSFALVYPKWCDYDEIGLTFENPAGIINVEFFARNLALQTLPVPSRGYNLPAEDGLDFCVKTPVAPALLQKSLLPANNLGAKKLINHFFPYGDTVDIHLTRAANSLDTAGTNPAHKFYLVLFGYNCPEPESEVW
jgi:hypothetical protein